MKLKDKVVLVTGASKGIGEATATALAKEGASVIVNYNTDTSSVRKVVQKCNKYSKENIAFQADIKKESAVQEMFKEIKKRFNKLDVLVNNAGITYFSKTPSDQEAFDNNYQNNLAGHLRVTNHALKLMKKGKIVNVSSVHGKLGHGNPSVAAFGALKAALDSYSKNLAKDLAPNILVNAVAPGRTLTPLWGKMTKQEIKEYGDGQLIKRFITAEEVADSILFLLKNDAMCGEVLTIDGGMSLKTLG